MLATAGSDEKLMRCRELGAEVTINYKRESFPERVAEPPAVAASTSCSTSSAPLPGRTTWLAGDQRAAGADRLPGGIARPARPRPDHVKRLNVFGTTLRRAPLRRRSPDGSFAAFALARFEAGELRPVVDSVLPPEQAAEAHRHMENSNTGKIVLKVA